MPKEPKKEDINNNGTKIYNPWKSIIYPVPVKII